MMVVKANKTGLRKAVRVLKEGGIVFCPTDTIYGLVADATNAEAVERLYSIRRPSGRPFIMLIPDLGILEYLDLYADRKYWDLLYTHVTVIFYKKTSFPLYLTRGKKSIAIRLPKEDSFVMELMQELETPLVAPSANPEGKDPAVDISMAQEYFGNNIDLYVDAGYIKGAPSTIVRLIGKKSLRLVREGNIKFKDFLQQAKRIIT
jgi:L-threonylcarbamoyladenylate synthase